MKKVIEKNPMAIKWRLKVMMAERDINNVKLAELTGLHVGTIAKLRSSPPDRYEAETLEKLCKALNCQISDLLIYIPDSKGS